MLEIRKAIYSDVPIIIEIAQKTWPTTYGKILSQAQLDYMLDKFYSHKNLKISLETNQHYYILEDQYVSKGFFSIEHHFNSKLETKIHKIYILPNNQGRGMGKFLIENIEVLATQNGSKTLQLNVNRFNVAVEFYKKLGFKIFKNIDIEIGNGYLMEDFEMVKIIN